MNDWTTFVTAAQVDLVAAVTGAGGNAALNRLVEAQMNLNQAIEELLNDPPPWEDKPE
jgi:hypothetical protein